MLKTKFMEVKMKHITHKARKFVKRMENKASSAMLKTKHIISGNSGEGYVDTAVKILIAVVIGALVLAGLYKLFGETVMPTLTQRIQEMFNYRD